MTVIDLKREKGHLVEVCFKNGESVALDLDFCAEKCIHKGDELTRGQIDEYKAESDYVRAKSRALWLLDRYTYSERRLFEKLKQAGFGEEASARALARLKELGLIDDKSLAARYAGECSRRGISKREAYGKLYLKGFNAETVKAAIEDAGFDEKSQIQGLLERKYKSKLLSGETDKVYAALIRKGFSFGEVRNALKQYSEELELNGEM